MPDTSNKAKWTDYLSFTAQRHERVFGDRVNRCFIDRPRSLFSIFATGLEKNGPGEAIIDGDKRLTYSQLDTAVSQVAGGLRLLGVAKGDRVAMLMGNSAEYVSLIYAISKLGAIIVPLNIKEEAPELAFILNDCGASVLIYEIGLRDRVPDAEHVPGISGFVAIDLSSGNPLAPLASGSPVYEAIDTGEEDLAAILYTSGTTGRPKGAMISNLNIAHSVLHYQEAMGIGPTDRSIIAVPMSHITGLIALICLCSYAGAALIVMSQFKAERFLELAERERMTHTLLVPAMFALCLMRPEASTRDLSAWRVAGYGGAIMPETTLHTIGEALENLQLINVYGATETTSPAVMMPSKHAVERADQVGLPVPCADIRVMDERGREVPSGEEGEIWISGPMVVKGYWDNPDATQKEFVGSYWRSGDVGSADEQGFIRIIDRIKDVINRGGYKIYASEVENLLLKLEGVREVAAVAKSCPVLGERVHAFVVADAGTSAADLNDYCSGTIAEYKRPEQYHFVDELPRNANGKVLKKDLRARLDGTA